MFSPDGVYSLDQMKRMNRMNKMKQATCPAVGPEKQICGVSCIFTLPNLNQFAQNLQN